MVSVCTTTMHASVKFNDMDPEAESHGEPQEQKGEKSQGGETMLCCKSLAQMRLMTVDLGALLTRAR